MSFYVLLFLTRFFSYQAQICPDVFCVCHDNGCLDFLVLSDCVVLDYYVSIWTFLLVLGRLRLLFSLLMVLRANFFFNKVPFLVSNVSVKLLSFLLVYQR